MPNPMKSKDARKVLEFNINTHTKGFTAETTIDGSSVKEYFHFREIHQIIHHPNRGVEIVSYNDSRRVFYNDEPGESQQLYDAINGAMVSYMKSNLN